MLELRTRFAGGSRRVVRPLWRCSFGFSGWMQYADVLLGVLFVAYGPEEVSGQCACLLVFVSGKIKDER